MQLFSPCVLVAFSELQLQSDIRTSLPKNLVVNYGCEVNRQSDYPTVKQDSHPPPKKPLPMNPLASPVSEWGAPGAYTRSKILDPHNVPN